MTMPERREDPEVWYTYYVASPYTHKDPEVRQGRHKTATEIAKRLTQLGYSCFVPIAYDGGWEVDPNFQIDHSWNFWERIDLPILDRCSGLILMQMPDWEKSQGIAGELEHCRQHGIPVMPFTLDDLQTDEVVHRKMALLKMMIRHAKRS
jgi:hypothetical protein